MSDGKVPLVDFKGRKFWDRVSPGPCPAYKPELGPFCESGELRVEINPIRYGYKVRP